jgi:hypothetical protein
MISFFSLVSKCTLLLNAFDFVLPDKAFILLHEELRLYSLSRGGVCLACSVFSRLAVAAIDNLLVLIILTPLFDGESQSPSRNPMMSLPACEKL